MFNDLDGFPKRFMQILLGVTIVSALCGIFAIYNIIQRVKPKTLGVSYATTLSTSSGEVPICEVEIWENVNNNGQEAYSIRFNSYTDAEGSWVKGFGMQVLGSEYGTMAKSGLSTATNKSLATLTQNGYFEYGDTIVFGEWDCYQSDDNGVSSYVLDKEKMGNNLYIEIKDKFYQIVLNSYEYRTTHYKWYGKRYYKYHNTEYTWFDLASYIINSAKKDSAKLDNSVYYISLLECSDYYHLLYQDDRGQYHPLSEVSDLKNYLEIKVTYHADGLTKASDSMFKQVRYNPSWSYYSNTEVDDFWATVSVVYLDETNIDMFTVESTGKIYLTIDKNFAKYLSGLEKSEIVININLDNLGYEPSGINMSSFNFDIKEFNIYSSTTRDFEVLNATTISPNLVFGGGINE